MDEGGNFQVQNIHTLSYKRSPDRRVSNTLTTENRRRITRRGIGIGWIPLFKGVEENLLLNALDNSEMLLLPAGASLMKPGDINFYVYILLSGKVHAYLDATFTIKSAIEVPLGQCIGELSMIDGKPVSAKIAAETDAYLLKLSREVFWDRLMIIPGVASNLLGGFTERMRSTNDIALRGQREQLELLHLRKELDVARQLQISMLPLQRPLFLDRPEIDACGSMEPASNVGGDLFDAFFVGDKTLFFCIGDVSGHGIAAALFMARTIGLLRILAMNYKKPAKLLEMLNERLCVGNDTNLFVTLFCGFLNVKTGVMQYSNAGHCAPILISGGKVAPLAIPKGVIAGVFPSLKYKAMKHTFDLGDTIFCYTDGVTEAQNQQGEEFSEERCMEFLNRTDNTPLSELVDAIRQEVITFTQSKILDDDCTMIALRRTALPQKKVRL